LNLSGAEGKLKKEFSAIGSTAKEAGVLAICQADTRPKALKKRKSQERNGSTSKQRSEVLHKKDLAGDGTRSEVGMERALGGAVRENDLLIKKNTTFFEGGRKSSK